MRVLIAAHDVRVRRALSRLLELDGHRIVGAPERCHPLPPLPAGPDADLVILELDRHERAQDLALVGELTRRGCAVIAVCSGRASCAGIRAAGAQACLDKDADFPDRLTDAVRLVAAQRTPVPPAAPA